MLILWKSRTLHVNMHKKYQQQICEVRDQKEYQMQEDFPKEDEPEKASSSIGTISSNSKCVHSISRYAEKIFASHTIKIKLDTEADTCILTENQMWLLPFKLKIRITNTILKGYGCSRITSIALTNLNIMLKNKAVTRFDIVNTPPKQPLYFWMIN